MDGKTTTVCKLETTANGSVIEEFESSKDLLRTI